MRIERRAFMLAQVGLAVLVLCGAAALAKDTKDTSGASHAKLAGRWEIVPERSDDPGKAADVLLAPPQAGEGRPPLRGRGMGGIGGGYPGGRGGMGGWGRGGGWGHDGRGAGGDDESTPPSETERAAMRDAIKEAVEGGSPVEIADAGSEIGFQFPEGRTRRVGTDGRELKVGRLVEKAQWRDGALELKTETRRLRIKETWALSEAGDEILVEVHAKRRNYNGELALRRVYRRAVEGAPAAQEAPAEPPSVPPRARNVARLRCNLLHPELPSGRNSPVGSRGNLSRRATMQDRESRTSRRVGAVAVAVTCLAVVGAAAVLRAEQAQAPVRSFEIAASKYKFSPARIEVNEGDRVRLVLHSTDTTHGFEIREYGVNASIPKGNEPVTVEFVADKPGTFVFKCSHFCGLGHHRMKGQLVVAAQSH